MKKRLVVLLVVAVGLAMSPAGWTSQGGNAHAGWSWNAEVASVDGDVVTLVSKNGSTLALEPIDGADPVAGEDVRVIELGLIWDADQGGTVQQPLGWSWND